MSKRKNNRRTALREVVVSTRRPGRRSRGGSTSNGPVLSAMPVRRRMPQRLVARREEAGVMKRYEEMGIAGALSRPWDYPTACHELAAILRQGYADLPKAAQALVASDVLTAFKLLPDVQTGYALPAANVLLQAVEVSLPKQKKSQAVSEFKCSVVAHKRRDRAQQKPGPPHIPDDVLVHIFSFLDMRSLVAAGLVCWSWNFSANDNNLWKMNYALFFSICHLPSNSIPVSDDVQNRSPDSVLDYPNLNWKEVFQNKYAGYGNWSFASNRALCQSCWSVLWLTSLTCTAPHHCPKNGKDEIKLVSLIPHVVACNILKPDDPPTSSSDNDNTYSDSEDNVPRRFWNLIITEI